MGIPNGIPLIFKFKLEGSKLVPVKQELAEAPLSGEFLEKKVSGSFYEICATMTSFLPILTIF